MKIKKGIYEQVLTEVLKQKIEQLKEKFGHEKEEIETEESSTELSLFLGKLIKQALDLSQGSSEEKIKNQISICNDIIDILAVNLEDDLFSNWTILI
jgi:hypothetical protein